MKSGPGVALKVWGPRADRVRMHPYARTQASKARPGSPLSRGWAVAAAIRDSNRATRAHIRACQAKDYPRKRP